MDIARKNEMDEIALLQEIVRLPSVTPDDAGCQVLIANRLEKLGFSIEWLSSDNVTNLWARYGKNTPLLCFAGHTDVVPAGDISTWDFAPFSATIDDGKCYGRGTSDMKGGVAAFITAIEQFVLAHPDMDGSIAVLLTSDEEGPAISGTINVVNELKKRQEKIDYCIVAEPTCDTVFGDTIKNGRRGSLSGRLTVHGKQGHVAYAHLAENPVFNMAPVIAQWAERSWDSGGDGFPPTTFQISAISAGVGADNVIPPEAKLSFNFRHAPISKAEKLKQMIVDDLEKAKIKYTLDWTDYSKPYWNQAEKLSHVLASAIEEETGICPQKSTGGGTSDARFLIDISDQIVEFGLTNHTIHQVNEYATVEEVRKLKRIFYHTMNRLFVTSDNGQEAL